MSVTQADAYHAPINAYCAHHLQFAACVHQVSTWIITHAQDAQFRIATAVNQLLDQITVQYVWVATIY